MTKPASARAPARKLVIKPLKLKPKLPADFEDATWAKLKEAVQAVNNKRAVTCSLEELYRAVEDLCLHKMAVGLYTRLQVECDAHIGTLMQALADSEASEPAVFLEQVEATWEDLCAQMLTIRQIFLYLDRSYVISASGVRSLFEMGLQLFRSHLAAHPEVERKTVQGLLQLIESERRGDAVNRVLLSHLLRMLTALGIYEESFQGVFLERSTHFYSVEGAQYMQETDAADYLVHCERRLAEEYERCAVYLDPATRKPLVAVLEQQLLEHHTAGILEKGFDALVAEGRREDLARLYKLLGRVGAYDAMRAAFKDHIKKTGLALVLDEKKDKEMVASLLKMKTAMDLILNESFACNDSFTLALKEAFEHFINQRQNKPAELIAKFLDAELRSGNKGQTEEEIETLLDKALILFRYISGKDVFEAFYKKDLAKRLLLSKSASVDAEKAMIGKLKAECGSQFTTKLEGMFKDVDLSRDIMAGFHQSTTMRSRIPGGFDMNVNILTSGYWPSYPIIDAKMPAELNDYQQVFKDFYLGKHSGRRLVWHNSLGTCVLKARFDRGVKELSVSLFQTVTLMLFNDVDTLSFAEIAEATGIEDSELRRTLQSLACGKVRVVVKEPKGREVNDGDTFSFNQAFSEKLYRIKINSIQLKETVEENKKTNDQVLQDRQYQIDAAIVRVMKTRKTLSHKLLVGELLVQLKFPVRGSDLKKRIESLIDREYLARDSGDPNVYIYLA